MSKIALGILSGFFAFVLPGRAGDRLAPQQVIRHEGELVISDGSSYYDFRKDGRFISGPIDGISGRVIEGTWTIAGDKDPNSLSVRFVIKGEWSWVNGASPLNDRRAMTMAVYAIDPKFVTHPKPDDPGVYGMEEKTFKVYPCYFIIETIEKASN